MNHEAYLCATSVTDLEFGSNERGETYEYPRDSGREGWGEQKTVDTI